MSFVRSENTLYRLALTLIQTDHVRLEICEFSPLQDQLEFVGYNLLVCYFYSGLSSSLSIFVFCICVLSICIFSFVQQGMLYWACLRGI